MTLLAILLAFEIGDGDGNLAERLQRRDPEAFAELYDRYGRLTYSIILAIVRDQGIAEDLVQETFLRVWNRVHAFDAQRGNMGPWLIAIARHRAIDYIRSTKARVDRNTFEFLDLEHPALYVDSEQDLITADRARKIQALLDQLNENQKTVIYLAYYEGLSQTEMAERMGQPLGTVKSWVRTALKKLREDLGT
jgi:RNA polymerase sigma-70 factor, ECF subfamily